MPALPASLLRSHPSLTALLCLGGGAQVVQKIFMHHQPTALIPSSLHLTAPEPNCTSWKNGGTCTLGDEAMLAASVSAGKDGKVQAKLVNYGAQTVRLRVDHGSGQRCAAHRSALFSL